MRRAAVIAGGVALAILVAALVWVQLRLPGQIAERIEGAIAARESMRGGVEGIRVCVLCGSYTLVRPELSLRSGGDSRPWFSADRVVVSLLPLRFLAGEPAGRVRLDAPLLRMRAGGGSSRIDWRRIGEVLLPIPLDALEARDGTLELANATLDPPVRWRLTGVRLEGTNLAGHASEPAAFRATGALEGEGEIRTDLGFPPEGGFALELAARGLPVAAFNDYLRNAVGVDVSAGRLDADGRVSGDAQGRVAGTITCRVEELDILQWEDFSLLDPLGGAWQGFAASALAVGGSSEGALELELEIRDDLADPGVDALALFGRVLQRSVRGLLEAPARALLWLARRSTPLEGGGG